MKTITLRCANCDKEFEKETKEYRRQIKQGKTRFFCDLSCVCIKRNEENPPEGNVDNFGGKTKRDEFTPFRWFILRAEYRDRKRNYGCDITVEYLKQLWEEQNGICPFTGWNLVLPRDTRKGWDNNSPTNASLDRIDNTKGYVKGNVRFVAVIANWAKNEFSDNQLKQFCKAVVNNEMALM